MSMISGQVDRLRTAAQTYRRLGNHSAESMLLDAADTIWKLRDDLQRTNADNAKLRKLVRNVHALHWNGLDCTECPWFDECDTTGGCPWLSIFADHMRELGIEVD